MMRKYTVFCIPYRLHLPPQRQNEYPSGLFNDFHPPQICVASPLLQSRNPCANFSRQLTIRFPIILLISQSSSFKGLRTWPSSKLRRLVNRSFQNRLFWWCQSSHFWIRAGSLNGIGRWGLSRLISKWILNAPSELWINWGTGFVERATAVGWRICSCCSYRLTRHQEDIPFRGIESFETWVWLVDDVPWGSVGISTID